MHRFSESLSEFSEKSNVGFKLGQVSSGLKLDSRGGSGVNFLVGKDGSDKLSFPGREHVKPHGSPTGLSLLQEYLNTSYPYDRNREDSMG